MAGKAALIVLSLYASSPGCRAYFYADLAASSPEVAETISSTHCMVFAPTQAEWV